jgi:hypothetical protein
MPKGIYDRSKARKKVESNGSEFVIPDQVGDDDDELVGPGVVTKEDEDIVNELEQDASINKHEGSKYLRNVYSVRSDLFVEVDIYEILEAFKVTCPAVQHACKKLLASGQRGKGSVLEDLIGAKTAIERAIELERRRERRRNGKS